MGPKEASTLQTMTLPASATGALSLQTVPMSPATMPTTPGSASAEARRSSPVLIRSLARTSPGSTVSATSIIVAFAGSAGGAAAAGGSIGAGFEVGAAETGADG